MTEAQKLLPLVLDFMARAGALASSIQATAKQQIKEDRPIVTEADLAISAMFADLVQGLGNADAHFIIDEETCGTVSAAQPALGKAKYVWVLDPIDGTAPYAHGLPLWGVMAALYIDGIPALAAINLPALGEMVYCDDRNAYYVAASGAAPVILKPITPQPLHSSAIVMAASWLGEFDKESVLLMDVHAAAAYAAFAILGRCRASFFKAPMKLWDIAPALVLAPYVGLAMHNVQTGEALAALPLQILNDDWKVKDMHVFCHPSQFDVLRKLPRR